MDSALPIILFAAALAFVGLGIVLIGHLGRRHGPGEWELWVSCWPNNHEPVFTEVAPGWSPYDFNGEEW